MSKIQHQTAHRLLPILAKVVLDGEPPPSYTEAARLLGRDPKRNARMVAQVCDLLDAAAACAGVPLLALITVREKSGEINRKAWVSGVPVGLRGDIISRSERHRFTTKDFAAIRQALTSLEGLGNRAAWDRFRLKYPRKEDRHRALRGEHATISNDAIDDIGSDRPVSGLVSVNRYDRDPKVRATVLKRANGRCEHCGQLGFICANGERYLETHHIIALAKDGADKLTNVIALCAQDHRMAHFSDQQAALEAQMIEKVRGLSKLR
jgi:5-methylcytosine-specific restriction endonuclease McrA